MLTFIQNFHEMFQIYVGGNPEEPQGVVVIKPK